MKRLASRECTPSTRSRDASPAFPLLLLPLPSSTSEVCMRAVSTTFALDHRRACDDSDTYAGSAPHDLAIRAGRVNQQNEVVVATCEFWTSSLPSPDAGAPRQGVRRVSIT